MIEGRADAPASVLVAITGASGARYGVACVQRLAAAGLDLDVVVSHAGRQVLALEERLGADARKWIPPGGEPNVRTFDAGDIAAPPASGSRAPSAMLIIPCSMGTAARIASGASSNLIERAADVMLKEHRPLVVVPRETPLSTLHLRNLLALSELGVRVVPAMPAFYAGPASVNDLVDFVVDRAIAAAGLPLPLRQRWRSPSEAGRGEAP